MANGPVQMRNVMSISILELHRTGCATKNTIRCSEHLAAIALRINLHRSPALSVIAIEISPRCPSIHYRTLFPSRKSWQIQTSFRAIAESW